MKNDFKLTCIKCGETKPKREIKRLNDGLTCKKCIKEKRKEHREFLRRKICGIRKREDIIKEAIENKEERRKLREIVKPIIRGVKDLRISRQIHLYLTGEEKQVLYFKALDSGMTSEEANKKVKGLCSRMSKLVVELRKEIKNDKELSRRFKEEFAKMCEEFK